ncbi:MAG: tetratricopeptide repeat protein [Limnochordia bacterium]|jgi:tetratricopeptide (TPR) repeat protein|nr:tetratricopeptide repeat protein [Limnochordia bacterium]MDD2629044.1 tetratricopeptide repeat protein [Limnochordia bacterium]MDD4517808.1 tetratricopeptide repeat protein [Limnochordia bacterium]
MTQVTLGEKIRRMRKRLNLTQQELAGDDFTKSFISQLEKNEANPSLKSLQIIAQRLNKPISFFLEDEIAPPIREADYEVEKTLAVARGCEKKERWDQAIGLYEKALEDLSVDHFYSRGKVYLGIARCLIGQKDINGALDPAQKAIEELELAGDDSLTVQAHYLHGVICHNLGWYDTAKTSFEVAYDLMEHADVLDAHLHLKILIGLGHTHALLGNQVEAVSYLQRAMKLSQETNDFFEYGSILTTLGFVFHSQNRLSEALQFTEDALAFLKVTKGPKREIARLHINLAVIHRESDHFEEAMNQLQVAESLLKEDPARDLLPLLYEEYGFVLTGIQQHEEAVPYLEKSLELLDDLQMKVPVQIALGKAYRHLGDYPAARDNLELALATLKAQGDNSKQTAAATYQLGLVYQQLGQVQKAQELLAQAGDLFENIN